MFAIVGPSPLLVWSRLLLLAVLVPVVGALLALWAGRGGKDDARRSWLSVAAYLPATLALAAALLGLAELGSLPAGYKAVFGGALLISRVGSFDATLALSLDGLSGPVMALSAGLLLAAQAWSLRVGTAPRASMVAALNVLGAASFLLVLGDGPVTQLFGFALESAAALVVASLAFQGSGERALARLAAPVLAAQVALMAGGAMLFWGTAGSYTPAGYVSDTRARFLALESPRTKTLPKGVRIDDDDDDDDRPKNGKPLGRAEQGSISMVAAPGARLYLDGGLSPFAVTPFVRKQVGSGAHSAHLVLGDGADDLDLPGFKVLAGSETTLTVAWPTTSYRELTALLRARDTDGPLAIGARLTAPAPLGSTSAWVVTLVALAVLFRAAAVAVVRGLPPAVLAATTLLPLLSGGYLIARLLLTLGGDSIVVTALGAAVALWLGISAFRAEVPHEGVARATAAHVGVAVAAAGAGIPTVGNLHMMAAAAAGALVLFALQSHADGPSPRASLLARVGAASLGLVPPGAGVAWTALDALRQSSNGTTAALVGVALAGACIGAAAAWRAAGALPSPATVTAAVSPASTASPAKSVESGASAAKKKKKKGSAAEAPVEKPATVVGATESETPVIAGAVALALAPLALGLGFVGSTSVAEGSLARLARSASPDDPFRGSLGTSPLVLGITVLAVATFAWTRAKTPRAPSTGASSTPTTTTRVTDALLSIGRAINGADAAIAAAIPAPAGPGDHEGEGS